jgi:hypothetical protein
MSTGKFRVACRGFGQHEQGLLQQQLKMLRGRTQVEWHYVGEDRSAELTLLRDEDQPATSATAIFKDGRFTIRRTVEWPLRIVGLYDLLTGYEDDLADRKPLDTPPFSLRLSTIASATYFDHEGTRFVILPHEDSLFSDIEDFDTLLQRLETITGDLIAAPLNSAPGKETLQHVHSLKRLVWALCLAEPISPDTLGAMQASEYRIAAWPDYGEWQSSPALLRLAALYSRQFATIKDGEEFARASKTEVVAFLNACERCALGLSTRSARNEPPATSPIKTSAQEGMLSKLRKRLGMAFGRSNPS